MLFRSLTFPAIEGQETARVFGPPVTQGKEQEVPDCSWRTENRWVSHTERTWWLLAANPFVILADGAGTAEAAPSSNNEDEPLAAVRTGVRLLRAGPPAEYDECWNGQASPVAEQDPDRSPVWPWGIAVNVLLGATGWVVAVRRLRIPQRRLPRGTRVA